MLAQTGWAHVLSHWGLSSLPRIRELLVTTSHVDIIHVATHVTSNQSVKKEEKICLSKFFVSQKVVT